MKRVFKIEGTTYTINTSSMNYKNTPDFYMHTEDELLDIREDQVKEEASKKRRKPRVTPGHRNYPSKDNGEAMGTKEYIREYYSLNSSFNDFKYGSAYGAGAIEESMVLFGFNK